MENKRTPIGKIIGRSLLILLGVLIIILLLVFFLDRYKAESFNDVDNAYEDGYFQDEETLKENGFVFYNDFYNGVYNYYCLNQDETLKKAYKANLDELLKGTGLSSYLTFNANNFSVDKAATTLEKIKALLAKARYQKEVSYLFSSYSTGISTLNRKLNAMTTFESWVSETYNLPEEYTDEATYTLVGETYYWVLNGETTSIVATDEERSKGRPTVVVDENNYCLINGTVQTNTLSLKVTKPTYKTVSNKNYFASIKTDYASVKDFLKEKGCSLETDAEIVNALSSGVSALTNASFNATDENLVVLMYLLDQDFIKNADNSIYYQISGFNQAEYDNLVNVIDELKSINTKLVPQLKENLYTWANYYSKVLLGTDGAVNPTGSGIKYELNDGSKRYYEFDLDSYTTSFKLYLKEADGTIVSEWDSNPDEIDESVNQHVYQHSTYTVYYSTSRGLTASYTTYEHSVADHSLTSNDALTPNFAIKYDKENNKIIVWYHVEKRGIDYSYFPQYISAEHMQELLARNKQMVEDNVEGVQDLTTYKENGSLASTRLTINFYTLITKDNVANQYGFDYYEHQGSYANMSKLERDYLYKYLYQWCGYASDEYANYEVDGYDYKLNDLEYDNASFGQDVDNVKPSFSFAVEYSLDQDGLGVMIPGNSIQDTDDYPICYIDVLPYFTATASGIEGYTVIPDGSGEVLNHDNGNTAYPKYTKRVYTTDLTDVSYVNEGESNDLMLPMYGVINASAEGSVTKRNGILAHIESNAASFGFTADPTRDDNYFNMNYYTLYLRENKDVVFGQAAYERTTYTKWTSVLNSEDSIIKYQILASDDLSYNDLAEAYREILIKKYNITSTDTTTTPTLDLDVLGMYTYTDNIAGIQYTAKDTLTTFDQLTEMVDDLLGTGVNNINVSYMGWRNVGLTSKSYKKIRVSSLCGAKAKFQALLETYNEESNVTVYPYVDFIEYESFYESFGNYHYVSHAVDGSLAKRQPYDLNSNAFDTTKSYIYALSPRYYGAFANQLLKNYEKASKGASTLAIKNLGSTLVGDYKKNSITFKANAVEAQIEALDILTNGGIDSLTLYTPYDYAFKYVSVAKEIPYQGTQYEILDYSIPFYQLVVNGLFDYSGESINANSGKGLNEHIMRIIETGSNISFTFTYDSSEKLLQTNYNEYYYTLYTDWLEDVKTVYNELNNLGIYKLQLTSHERVANNVYKVTYSKGQTSISIYLNYTRNPYTTLDGTVIPAKSYKVANN